MPLTPEQADAAVAAQLRAERARRDWTQAELAGRAGLHYNTIHRIEKGQRGMSLAQLYAICGALGIDPGEFLDAAQAAAISGK